MSKFNTKNPQPQIQRLPAGLLPGDYAVELFGVRETRKVYGLTNGQTIPFANINSTLKATIFDKMISDDLAMEDLRQLTMEEALEEYAFCLFGAADDAPDFTPQGLPGAAENFVCGHNCRCMKWRTKKITLNGNMLTQRQITISQHLASDMPDKQIASKLNITPSTLDIHKRALYGKAGVNSKAGFLVSAIKENVIH